jgi:hypothetical protein
MDLTPTATLASPPATTPGRRTRCQVLDITRRGVNRCTDEAVDPVGEILICLCHLAAALELVRYLPGIEITIAAREASG